MSDLPSRLRAEAPHVEGWEDGETGESVPFADTLREAADEIERLRAEVSDLRGYAELVRRRISDLI